MPDLKAQRDRKQAQGLSSVYFEVLNFQDTTGYTSGKVRIIPVKGIKSLKQFEAVERESADTNHRFKGIKGKKCGFPIKTVVELILFF